MLDKEISHQGMVPGHRFWSLLPCRSNRMTVCGSGAHYHK